MLVVGIDPGIAITGIAFIKENQGKQTLLYASSVTTLSNISTSERLAIIYSDLLKSLKKYQPDYAVLENLFFNTNAKTALIVGQARGVVQLVLAQNKIPVVEYTPLQVKLALTGYGRADKTQIQKMVAQILKLPEILTPDDVADAAAIALTHCFSYKLNEAKSVKR